MNSVVYPMDYATWRGGHQHTVQLIINLAEEPLLLAEGPYWDTMKEKMKGR